MPPPRDGHAATAATATTARVSAAISGRPPAITRYPPQAPHQTLDSLQGWVDSLVCMATDSELPPTEKTRKPWHFQPGYDPRRDGSGRKRITPEQRQFERMTREHIQRYLDEMLGPALLRLLKLIKQKPEEADEGTALRTLQMLLDRSTLGPVPSAAFVAAQISSVSGNAGGVGCITRTPEEVRAALTAYLARLPPPAETVETVTIDNNLET